MTVKIAKKSLWRVISAKCMECCGDYREEVRECTVRSCSLRPYRPYQQPGEWEKFEEESGRALRRHTTKSISV